MSEMDTVGKRLRTKILTSGRTAGMEITCKFYDVKEKLPEKSGDYLVINWRKHWWSLHYSVKHKAFNVYDDDEDTKDAISADYWAELPDIPKED